MGLIFNRLFKNKNDNENNIKERIKIFDKSIYDNRFPIQVRENGEKYFNSNKINNYINDNNKYSCIVKGSKDYKVSVTFKNNSNEIENVSCTCSYFADKKDYCKHIYALIYKVKCSGNKEIIINKSQEKINNIKEMINNSKNYMDNNKSRFNDDIIQKHSAYIYSYNKLINNIESKLNNNTLEDELVSYLEQLIRISYRLKEKIKKTHNSDIITKNSKPISTSNNSSTSIGGLLLGISVMSALSNMNKNDKSNNNDLEDWQRKEVKKGNYDPWNFEEEDLEDDDYYSDDD